MIQSNLPNQLWNYLRHLSKPYSDIWATLLSTPSLPMPNKPTLTENPTPVIKEKWYYPPDIAHDLDAIPLPQRAKEEIYACAWEYTRCVIPQYTNWNRYVAFMRIIIIGIIAEFKGDMIDVAGGDEILGYNLSTVLDQLFEGTVAHKEMTREFRCFLLITGDKASSRGGGLLFRRYVAALAKSPQQWFRMRDTDALIRFTIGAALACNDLDDIWYTEQELEMLDELGATLYDSVAYFKHRSEGETNSTFAYVPDNIRIQAFHQCREVLWALDVAWAGRKDHLVMTNFLRFFGGPIHMMMRRYRFVEEGLTIGKPENSTVVKQVRQHVKLWNRVGSQNSTSDRDVERYNDMLARKDDLMFEGLSEFLDENNQITCRDCLQKTESREKTMYAFGGVQLCGKCRDGWGKYVSAFPERFASVFPEVGEVMGCQAP